MEKKPLSPQNIIGWIQSGNPTLGICQEVHPNRIVVIDEEGKRHVLRPKDISVVGKKGDPKAIREEAEKRGKNWDLELLWNVLLDSGYEIVTPHEVAELYGNLNDDLDPFTAWFVLWNHPEYFAREGRNQFRVRSRKEREREAEKIRRKQREEAFLKEFEQSARQVKERSREVTEWVMENRTLQEILLAIQEGKKETPFFSSTVLERVKGTLSHIYEESRIRWPFLWYLGSILGDPDPWESSHPKLKNHIENISRFEPPPPLPEGPILKPSGEIISLDDAHTQDRDDAFAFAMSSKETAILDIAIADVTDGYGGDLHKLDILAELGTSVYLPTRTIHLLPPSWGYERHSLDGGTIRPVFLLRIPIAIHSGEILSPPEILRGYLPISTHLSYEEWDEKMGEEEPFTYLHRFTEILRKKRMEEGAQPFDFPEATVIVRSGVPVGLKRTNPSTGGRALVRELMILANTLFARFLQEKKVPAPFRIQEKYHQDRAPTVVRFHPAPHKGVGADAYLYATSPIRRVHDALAQRQLRSLLDLPPLPEKILYELSERSEKNYQEMRRWMRLADLYWKLRYLEQFPDTPLYGTVLRREEDKVLTRVSPIEVVFPIEKDHWKGEKVQSLKMVSVDAEKGELSLRWDNSPLPEDPFLSPEPVS